MVNGQALDEGRLCGRDPPWLRRHERRRVDVAYCYRDGGYAIRRNVKLKCQVYPGASFGNRHNASRLIPMSEILLVIAPIPRRKPSNFSTPRRSFLDRPRHAHSPPPAAVDAWRGHQV